MREKYKNHILHLKIRFVNLIMQRHVTFAIQSCVVMYSIVRITRIPLWLNIHLSQCIVCNGMNYRNFEIDISAREEENRSCSGVGHSH